MRVIFMGTPEFSVAALEALHGAGHEICAVYTRPPAKGGRGMDARMSPVHLKAEDLGLPVFTPRHFKDASDIEKFESLQADLAVVAAYGLILPPRILAAPKRGCWNIHASLLPRWRGAAPIQRAIMAGDVLTGVCIMQMEAELDTGPVLLKRETGISGTDTAADLHDRLMDIGAALIVDALHQMDSLVPERQPEAGATYADKISKEESRLDWSGDAKLLDLQIRGLSPFPGAWFEANGERIKVLAARATDAEGAPGTILSQSDSQAPVIACGNGALELLRLQRAGRSALPADEFQRGNGLQPGIQLS